MLGAHRRNFDLHLSHLQLRDLHTASYWQSSEMKRGKQHLSSLHRIKGELRNRGDMKRGAPRCIEPVSQLD